MGELAFGLEPAEFGGRFVEQTVGLGAGAVDGVLDAFGVRVGGFHGVEDDVLTVVEAEDEVGFDFATAAETPLGTLDLLDESFFEDSGGGEFVMESSAEGGVGAFFAGADEVAGE